MASRKNTLTLFQAILSARSAHAAPRRNRGIANRHRVASEVEPGRPTMRNPIRRNHHLREQLRKYTNPSIG